MGSVKIYSYAPPDRTVVQQPYPQVTATHHSFVNHCQLPNIFRTNNSNNSVLDKEVQTE